MTWLYTRHWYFCSTEIELETFCTMIYAKKLGTVNIFTVLDISLFWHPLYINFMVCKMKLTSYTPTLCLMESKLSKKKPKSNSVSEYFGCSLSKTSFAKHTACLAKSPALLNSLFTTHDLATWRKTSMVTREGRPGFTSFNASTLHL